MPEPDQHADDDAERLPTPQPLRPLSEAEQAATLEVVPGIMFVTDDEGRIRWMNRAPLGSGLNRFIGRPFTEFVVPEGRPLVEEAQARLRAGAALVELDVQGVHSRRWYHFRLTHIAASAAAPIGNGFAGHALDIDDAKRNDAERAMLRARLHASRTTTARQSYSTAGDDAARRLEHMADAVPLLIAYVDASRRYRYNNAAYERFFGTSRAALQGRSLEEVLGEAAFQSIRGYVDAALSGRASTFELTVPYKDAGVRRVVARYVPDLTGSGEVRGFFAIIEDVTERRAAQAQLRQQQEELRQLQKLEALGRLAGGIAHDFNNLLHTVVTGCAAALASLGADDSPAAGHMARIRRAAERGASLTRQLLSFARQSELRTTSLVLDELLGDLQILIEHLLESNIEVRFELAAGCRIEADAGQVQQALLNLALNARDAMPEGGRLTVTSARVALDRDDPTRPPTLGPGAYALITVTDTGTGMDTGTLSHVFDPFFTTKAEGLGTGLGLSTVYGIVTRLGGHVDVTSELGAGTQFRLLLPCD